MVEEEEDRMVGVGFGIGVLVRVRGLGFWDWMGGGLDFVFAENHRDDGFVDGVFAGAVWAGERTLDDVEFHQERVELAEELFIILCVLWHLFRHSIKPKL